MYKDLQLISKDLGEEQRIISYYSVWSYLILFAVTCLSKLKTSIYCNLLKTC